MEKVVSVMFSYVFFLANSVFLKTVMISYQKNLWPISLFSFSAFNKCELIRNQPKFYDNTRNASKRPNNIQPSAGHLNSTGQIKWS